MRTVALKKILIVMCLVVVPVLQVSAQDWKSILQGVASAVEDKASEKLAGKVETLNVMGTWQYIKPDVKLESDDLLSKAGGELAVQKGEQQLKEILTKIGIDERTVFIFNSDSTYAMRTDKRTMEGTYSLNKETREIIMTSRLNLKFAAVVDQNVLKPNNMSIRFKADKLMGLVKYVTGALAQKSTSKKIALVNTLLSKYDGLTLGFELRKENSKKI